MAKLCAAVTMTALVCRAAWAQSDVGQPQPQPPAAADEPTADIVVRSRLDQIGSAATASQGTVTQEEIELRPIARVGQIFEAVPGLVVTLHSGEGKANQFLARGFNLDHGTDFATFIDDMPVNEGTHAHGQGYSDIHYLIPELAGGLDYTKGPFYAQVGDFGAIGSARLRLLDDIPDQVSVSAGTLGDERVYAGGTLRLDDDDRLLVAGDLSHYDGPFDHPDNYRTIHAAARYVHGDDAEGFNVTAMYYRAQWNNTTDQPVSALEEGLISRYGNLDPSDGGHAERFSLSAHDVVSGDGWKLSTDVYAIHSLLTLWNDFTHFLVDPVHGDQEQQDETRNVVGGETAYYRADQIAGVDVENTVGLQGRYDENYIDRRHTEQRVVLRDCPGFINTGLFVCNADQVTQGDVAGYVQDTAHWLPWLRTVVGLREDYYGGTDRSLVTGFSGTIDKTLFQPKGSLVLGPWHDTELYVSAGRGYHTNDLRGVFGTVPSTGANGGLQGTSYLSKIISEEVGVRSDVIPKVNLTAAVFRLDFDSFLTYNQDQGNDFAGPPARLEGVELSAQYHPLGWLELNGDVNFTHTRYRTGDIAFYGLSGLFIQEAPDFIGSFGAIADRGPWFGGAELRWLSGYPLIEDDSFRSKGYKDVNIDAGYRFNDRLKVQLNIFNLFNSHAYAAQYAYEYQVSPTRAPQTGPTFHPLEPISAKLTVTATF
jgi:outer membrane receptor protein involved in Fe transport